MIETKNTTSPSPDKNGHDEQWPGIDSTYRLIVVASLRNKQLLHGATPRIEADASKRKNTSIALEEVKQGLVPFTLMDKVQQKSRIGDRFNDGF
ncbi:MAG TPA: DNA-directed RNA polymerase subunit omega [Pyrinomonadaceae bacterium]|jgi:DNA-directed RNA polymerase omega subunit